MSTGLIIGCVFLIAVVLVLIGKVTELAAKIRGEEEAQYETNNANGIYSILFLSLTYSS